MLEKIKEITKQLEAEFKPKTELKNDKLYIEGLFNVYGELFKDLKELGNFKDCNETVYFDIGTFNESYYKEHNNQTSRCHRGTVFYGHFIFEIDDTKPILLNEFLDKTGYIVDKYIKGEKTMAEWFLMFDAN